MDKELIFKASMLQQQSEQIEQKLGLIGQQLHELRKFKSELEEIIKDDKKEILAPLGKGIFLKSTIIEDKLFVDVGAGVLVKKTPEDTQKIVEVQITRLDELADSTNEEFEKINLKLTSLMSEIEKNK